MNKIWHLNEIPKIVHYYWGGESLSYLRFLSVLSFKELNKDWTIKIHMPKQVNNLNKTWGGTISHRSKVFKKNYIDQLSVIGAKLVYHDFSNHFLQNAHEVHRSDFIRWKILADEGGVWSDMDILYCNPIEMLDENSADNNDAIACFCPINQKHTIGFMMSSSKNPIFEYIHKLCEENYNPEIYQCMGAELLQKNFSKTAKLKKQFGKFIKILFLDPTCVYSIDHVNLADCYTNISNRSDLKNKLDNKKIIGIHWFASLELSNKFEDELTETNSDNYINILTQIIKTRNFKTRNFKIFKEKILTILGTRPEIIRLSRIIPKLDALVDHRVLHTGQNYDPNLNDIFFQELNLRQPDKIIDNKSVTFAEQLANTFIGVEAYVNEFNPDRVLILGDTNSGLAALICERLGIPVYHMEAGNRCYDLKVPEEKNRKVIDSISTINLPYTQLSRENLLREGVPNHRIAVTGNPIKEVITHFQEHISKSDVLERLNLEPQKYIIATAHRAENVDTESRLKNIFEAFNEISQEYTIVFSCHPRTKQKLEKFHI